jgi:glutamine cyclotransferase
LGWIDLRDLAALELQENPGADVLNGIAFHGETGRIFVTGKFWSSIYQIRLLSSSE